MKFTRRSKMCLIAISSVIILFFFSTFIIQYACADYASTMEKRIQKERQLDKRYREEADRDKMYDDVYKEERRKLDLERRKKKIESGDYSTDHQRRRSSK